MFRNWTTFIVLCVSISLMMVDIIIVVIADIFVDAIATVFNVLF